NLQPRGGRFGHLSTAHPPAGPPERSRPEWTPAPDLRVDPASYPRCSRRADLRADGEARRMHEHGASCCRIARVGLTIGGMTASGDRVIALPVVRLTSI